MSSSASSVWVNLASGQYEVLVEAGLLTRVGQHVRALSSAAKAILVSDSNVGPRYLPLLAEALRRDGIEPITVQLPAGEDHKSMSELMAVYDAALAGRIDRATPLLTLGGGVVGDMGGFAAATILRGIPFIQIPTTLLAMVDASVGGKTGVDHPLGKNLIGAFHQPRGVLIDPQVLRTLPPHELRSGLAECIKHDIIRDTRHFSQLQAIIPQVLQLDMDCLAQLIAHNVAIKARVVEADPFERGERAHLNFGHTFGHAIEKVSDFSFTHGQSVALGMVAAARLAVGLGMLEVAACQRMIQIIALAELPTGGMNLDLAAVMETMAFDKKVSGARIRFVLPTAIGRVVIRDDVPADAARRALESLQRD